MPNLRTITFLISLALAQTSRPVYGADLTIVYIIALAVGLGVPLLCFCIAVCFAYKKKAENDKVKHHIEQTVRNYQQTHSQFSQQSSYPQPAAQSGPYTYQNTA